mmetsp:Transcript_52926/g.116170  ORF Transcript_52926/g.116170 Transcript_52926/m.116170 type:complete len:224 (-) Transcript_52926:159-830(-)
MVLRQATSLLLGQLVPPALRLSDAVLLLPTPLLLAPTLLGLAGGGPRQGLAPLFLRLLASSLHLSLLALPSQGCRLSRPALGRLLQLLVSPTALLLLGATTPLFILTPPTQLCLRRHLATLLLSLLPLVRLASLVISLAFVIPFRSADQGLPDAPGAGVAGVGVGTCGCRGGGDGSGIVGVIHPTLKFGLLGPDLCDSSLNGRNLGLGGSCGGSSCRSTGSPC